MHSRSFTEDHFAGYSALTNIEVKNIDRQRTKAEQFEGIERYFEQSNFQYGLEVRILNFTGCPVRLLHRDHGEMYLHSEKISGIYNPPKGLYFRRTITPRSFSQFAFNNRCASQVPETPEAILLRELIRQHRINQRQDGTVLSAYGDPGLEYFIPIEKLNELNKPVYIPEMDVVLGLDEHSFEFPHPMNSLQSRKALVDSIVSKETDPQLTHASIMMYINDVNSGYQSRFMAVGDIIMKIIVQNNANIEEGFYIKTNNQFKSGDGLSTADFERITLDEADKRFMLGLTPEEALNKSHMELTALKREEHVAKLVDLQATEQTSKLKMEANYRANELADMQAAISAKKLANEEWYREYTKRKDRRNEILEWFKFAVSLLSSLFMIRAVFK